MCTLSALIRQALAIDDARYPSVPSVCDETAVAPEGEGTADEEGEELKGVMSTTPHWTAEGWTRGRFRK